ncbi:MAG: hypothetical protein ABL891_16295 [Burkholderiales bacterium]
MPPWEPASSKPQGALRNSTAAARSVTCSSTLRRCIAIYSCCQKNGLNALFVYDIRECIQGHESAIRNYFSKSGCIALEHVRAIVETAVDRISIGALNENIKAVDLSMRFGRVISL